MARNYRNRGMEGRIREGRRLDYKNENNRQQKIEESGNLNKKESLIVLD